MQKLKRKFKKNPLLYGVICTVTAMVLILISVFLLMDSTEPPVPAAKPIHIEAGTRQIPYSQEDFVRNKDGFMECVSVPFTTGIDVSFYQGKIDWEKVKADGVEYVFIRIGGRGSSDGTLYTDDNAQAYYEGAKKAGLQVGAYFFSQAISVEEAREEAEFALKQVKKWKLDLPLAYDWEWAEKGSRTDAMKGDLLTDCTNAFCQVIEEAGLQPMIYFNESQGLDMLDLEALQQYPFWLAMYDGAMDFPYRVDYWQYSEYGKVDGIDAAVDLNIFLPS